MNRMIAVGVLVLALAGCDRGSPSSGYSPPAPGAGEDVAEAPVAPEAPDVVDVPDGPGEESPEVPVARPPLNIPEYLQQGARFTDDIRQYIEGQWAKECGDGTVCVSLAFEPADGSLEPGECRIVEPYPSGTVEREGTVTYVLDRPCA
jgi:hypothetical protein